MPAAVGKVNRAQPVLPLALTVFRSNPPSNQPHVMSLALSRSPMLRPDMVIWSMVGLEHTSLLGIGVADHGDVARGVAGVSERLMGRMQQLAGGVCTLVVWEKPLAWPEIRLMAPGDDGPNWRAKLLSLIA